MFTCRPIPMNPGVNKSVPGLPMDLAEPRRENSFRQNVCYVIFHKVFLIVFFVGCVSGLYLYVFGGNSNKFYKTEIVVRRPSNESILTKGIKYMPSNAAIRRKRQTLQIATAKRNPKLYEKKPSGVRKILPGVDDLCNKDPHKGGCGEFIKKLEADDKKHKIQKKELRKNKLIKREVIMDNNLSEPILEEEASIQPDDSCLLNRLMRQSGPYDYGYGMTEYNPEYQPDLLNYPRQSQWNYWPSYHTTHENIQRHPQDIDIALSMMSKQVPLEFLPFYPQGKDENKYTFKTHPQDIETTLSINSNCRIPVLKDSSTTQLCPSGTMACSKGDCISQKQWCDGNVDCEDISDELQCSCRERVDRTRLCDGYFDCPFGEDEMGCFGCSDKTFSCEDMDATRSTCFTKEQRCNNKNDCPNHKDEMDCTMLAPSIHKKPLFEVSNTEGFLHRNFKGNWYPVCNNPYMWAHDACRRETGLIIRPPHIQVVQIDPLLKVNYLNTAHGGLIYNSTSCFNSSAIYVTCPDLLCGTRVFSSSQFIRENTENQLFGRNKRFLWDTNPYRFFFYDQLGRAKREMTSSEGSNEGRKKRTESRVVGGKPSQPAAWPWIVALYRNGMFHCGGVIVTQNWIMSAAHCVHKYWKHYFEVQVGMLRRFSYSPQEQNYKVTHIIVNQKYDQHDMKNDLSLLKVKPAIQFSRWVRPICLPGPEVAGADWLWGPPVGTLCTAVGWGSTVEHGPDPDHLREVELPIWEHCNHREDQAGKEICAGLVEGGRDTCQGDSGGPLLCQNPANEQQWYVAGIVSHGDGCARKGEPGVYTRVSLLIPWIKYHISSKNLPTIQPKQECPGFRCNSGITKCLPKNRMLDKIIDCLDGEDEYNCEEKQPRNLIDELLSITFRRNANESVNATNIIKKGPVKVNTTETDQVTASSNQTAFAVEITTEMIAVRNISKLESVNSTDHNHNINKNIPQNHTQINDNNQTEEYLQYNTTSSNNALEIGVSESSEEITDDPFDINTTDSIYTSSQNLVTNPNILQGESMNLDKSNISLTTERLADFSTEINLNMLSTTENTPYVHLAENFTSSTVVSTEAVTEYNMTATLEPFKVKDNATAVTENFPVENQPDLINTFSSVDSEMENVVYAIEATIYKAKHKFPTHFRCHKIPQIISYTNRCDHKADCEDGTDELDCTCIDFLITFERSLICDGNYNCADGQDEIDCFGCESGQFLCKRSQMCLSTKYVCDGKPQCPLGEDEIDCFALTNGKDISFDIDGRPKVRYDGFITKKQNNDWHVICEENMSSHEQEAAAVHMCRYLGFSNANTYKVKYINVQESNLHQPYDAKRSKRNKSMPNKEPVMFTYYHFDAVSQKARSAIISEPEVLRERCLPNVTKTCMTLYVLCDQSLYTNLDESNLFGRTAVDNYSYEQRWPWIAKLYTEGIYKCTGVLVHVSWVLFRNECAASMNTKKPPYNAVVLGSHKTLFSTKSLYEQVRKVDGVKDLYGSKAVLLHLQEPVEYSTMVKPMISSAVYMSNYERTLCVAVGEDAFNNTVSVLVKETRENCNDDQICFVRQSTIDNCPNGYLIERPWTGVISCHTKEGWYPAATFFEPRGECNMADRLSANEIGNLKYKIKYLEETTMMPITYQEPDVCDGTRCERGRCIAMRQVCDGVRHCEGGMDEAPASCKRKHHLCSKDPLYRGCECPVGQLKCRNGQCISKELFKNGNTDCSDGTDEPGQPTCSEYLSRVKPSRLCDGVLHCHDRSDEDPMFCKCFAKHAYRCTRDSLSEDYCVANDMVCDGIPDCPNGEDERTCIAISAPQGTPPGIGEVIIRSHGIWFSKCYSTKMHTKSELEAVCREAGFISGHAKQLPTPEYIHPHNNLVVDQFIHIPLNNNTTLRLRSSESPIARGTYDVQADCFPLFIECV